MIKITREVDKVMYATLIDTRARRIWDEGHDEGWDEGQVELFRNIVASGMSKEEAQRITGIRGDLAERAMQLSSEDE